MSRRVEPLLGDVVDVLPELCRSCLFWELAGPRPDVTRPVAGGAAADGPTTEALVRKEAWVSARVQEGMPPGRIVRVDGRIAGHAVYAPVAAFGRRRWPGPAPSEDALLLAVVWIPQEWRDHGLGRLLLQAAIRDAIRSHTGAVEAYGDRRWRQRDCMLPATWLLHEGFTVHREHPRVPLLRLDVRRTVRWAESLEHAWEEVLQRLPRRAPAPVVEAGHREFSAPTPTDDGRRRGSTGQR